MDNLDGIIDDQLRSSTRADPERPADGRIRPRRIARRRRRRRTRHRLLGRLGRRGANRPAVGVDTVTNVWSTTKTMTALSALLLIDRGQLDPNEKVAAYWPGFAANGKADIEVRHLMAHQPGCRRGPNRCRSATSSTTTRRLRDARRTGALVGARHRTSGYHALNQGHLVGEVIRRIDERGLKQFFADEIAGPLGADFTIGAPEAPGDGSAR
ncbi:MAG: serine hydrolase domain-containing protein [Ilumatobacteraceae bacterium]